MAPIAISARTISIKPVGEAAGAGAETSRQVPTLPGRLQSSPGWSHGVSQHTFCTQLPDWQSIGSTQPPPSGMPVLVTVGVALGVVVGVDEGVEVGVGLTQPESAQVLPGKKEPKNCEHCDTVLLKHGPAAAPRISVSNSQHPIVWHSQAPWLPP